MLSAAAATGFNMRGPLRISGIQGLGLGLEGSFATTGIGQHATGLKASYLISSYSFFSYHAGLNAGYLAGADSFYANGKAGLGFIIAFFDVGYMYSEADQNSLLQAGISFEQLLIDYRLMAQLYADYGFSLNNRGDRFQLGLKVLYILNP